MKTQQTANSQTNQRNGLHSSSVNRKPSQQEPNGLRGKTRITETNQNKREQIAGLPTR
jgi:hypothetical protein